MAAGGVPGDEDALGVDTVGRRRLGQPGDRLEDLADDLADPDPGRQIIVDRGESDAGLDEGPASPPASP